MHDLSHRTSEAVFRLREDSLLFACETFFMLVFMSKIRVKARLTSLHSSQGYRFSVEPNVKQFVILRAFKLGMFFDFNCFVVP